MPPRIDEYALLGDTRSAALVSAHGDIDWWCLPRFDSAPVCGRLLGGPGAGHLSLGPAMPATVIERDYLPGTPMLRTRWQCDEGRVTLTEGMVSVIRGRLLPSTLLVRRIEAHDHPVRIRWAFAPRYRWRTDRLRCRTDGPAIIFTSGTLALSVQASLPLPAQDPEEGQVVLQPGQCLTVVISGVSGEPLIQVPPEQAWQLLLDDAARWREWTSRIAPDLPFAHAARRSAMVLRLLTHSPTGAPVAAVTTSLPESIGGIRNWDYRYTWPRDASIGVAAFAGLGMEGEARMFLRWLLHASRLDRPRLPVLLTLDGRRAPKEHRVEGWPGYRGSTPVRTGNGARDQHQLDGYGWVVDAVHVFDSQCAPVDAETWRTVAGFADFAAERWDLPDAGIWEERSAPTHHTHSKLMAWLALDRALRLARTHRVRPSRVRRWKAARQAIGVAVRSTGFNDRLGSYTRTLGGDDLDAALLVLPLIGLEPAHSPRVRSTIDAVRQHLSPGGPYLYRYPPETDGLPGREGAFLPCSFWLVQALALTGRLTEAVELMHELVALSPLGLYAEEADPSTGEMLGNHPQALTHAALLQAVLALHDAGVGGNGDST